MKHKMWTITITDTGETIIGECGDRKVVERYEPQGGQSYYNDRDEAIGAVFAVLADIFEQVPPAC